MQAFQQPSDQNFSAKPKIVQNKGKYREQGMMREEGQSGRFRMNNLMHDKRVIRGNTYASITLSKSTDPVLVEKHQYRLQKLNEKHYQQSKTKKSVQQGQTLNQNLQQDIMTPPPEPNRMNIGLQTEEYIEILTDKPVQQEIDIQTDFFLDRPNNKHYKVKMRGTSVATQIQKGHLFDFDEEVEPILGNLIQKILEQSRMEVLEEQELEIIKEQGQEYEQKVRAKRQEMQRLAEIERRKREELERRMLQYGYYKYNKKESHKKLVGRMICKSLMDGVGQKQIEQLAMTGLFNQQKAMINDYQEWLMDMTLNIYQDGQHQNEQFIEYQSQIKDKQIHLSEQALQKQQKRIQQYYSDLEEQEKKKKEVKLARQKEKRKQTIMNEREQFKVLIESTLKKQERRDNIMAHTFTDIYYPGNKEPCISMMGGLITEVVVTMGLFHNILTQEEYHSDILANLQNVQKENPQQMLELLETFLETIFFKEGQVIMLVNESMLDKLKEMLQNDEISLENFGEHVNGENWEDVAKLIEDSIESLSYKEIVRNNLHNMKNDILKNVIKSVLKVMLKPEIINKKVKLVATSNIEKFETPFVLKMSPDENELNQSVNQDQSQSFMNYDDKVTLFSHHLDSKDIIVYNLIPTLVFRKTLLRTIFQKLLKKNMQNKNEKYILTIINKKTVGVLEEIVNKHVIRDQEGLVTNPFLMEFDYQ